MSEETTPAKKAARKSVRKKSAAKRSTKKSTVDPSLAENELPLTDQESGTRPDENSQERSREPKSGVRDARIETAGEPLPAEESVVTSSSAKTSNEAPRASDSGKGGSSSQDSKGAADDQEKPDGSERRSRGRGRGGRERGERRELKARIVVDPKELAKKAWKIFESEVTEEGLALLDDNGLRDYARSSFNAARLFLEEKERVVSREKQAEKQAKAEKKKREEREKDQHQGEDDD